MLAIVSAMAGTMLCNAPGVRREASLTILFTTHKMDAVYTAAASLGLRTLSRVMRRTSSHPGSLLTTKCHDDDDYARCECFPMTTQ